VDRPKILIIDDDPSIRELLMAYLSNEGYRAYAAADGPAGLEALTSFEPDLVVLDIMLPGLDGVEVLTRLRRRSNVYVIMLTAKSEEVDKIVGLSVGADDYVTKPFSPRELTARIKAALRRIKAPAEVETERRELLAYSRLRMDLDARKVWMDDRPVELTGLEFDLLQALAQHPDRVLTRPQLIEIVWGNDFYGEERVVDVHLGHVRQKLGQDHGIITVRGVGYRFEGDL